MTESRTIWQGWFGDIPPLGWVLRELCHDRWVRFHALPGSRRYAENAEEEQTVLSRANALAGCILDENSECALICTVWRDSAPLDWNPDWMWREDDSPESFEAAFQSSRHQWRTGVFDDVFREIANDETRAVLLNPSTGEVLAPYDGGFDVICRSTLSARRLKQTFASWLSAREDGL